MNNIIQKRYVERARRGCIGTRGFTLVETIVAMGLFTIVVTIASSALLNMMNADRASRGTRIATDNLNLALEDMVRRIKTGTTYNLSGGTLSFFDQTGKLMTYQRGVGPSGCGVGFDATQGCLLRQVVGDFPFPATSHEIDVETVSFDVGGVAAGDNTQPYVIVLVGGVINTNHPIKPEFNMQTMITQRQPDL